MTTSQYDTPGEIYARHSETNPWNEQYDRPAIHALTGEVNGRDVLDVGCAAGVLTAQLAARGAIMVGVDVSPVMLDIARRHGLSVDAVAVDAGLPGRLVRPGDCLAGDALPPGMGADAT